MSENDTHSKSEWENHTQKHKPKPSFSTHVIFCRYCIEKKILLKSTAPLWRRQTCIPGTMSMMFWLNEIPQHRTTPSKSIKVYNYHTVLLLQFVLRADTNIHQKTKSSLSPKTNPKKTSPKLKNPKFTTALYLFCPFMSEQRHTQMICTCTHWSLLKCNCSFL